MEIQQIPIALIQLTPEQLQLGTMLTASGRVEGNAIVPAIRLPFPYKNAQWMPAKQFEAQPDRYEYGVYQTSGDQVFVYPVKQKKSYDEYWGEVLSAKICRSWIS